MRSHSRAIHSSKAIPSRIIRNRDMGSSRAIHPKVEDIKVIPSKGMANNRDTLNKGILNRGMSNNKIIPSKDMVNNKAIPNKVMHNKDTGSNRAMDNHLPGKTCRPGNCP